MNTTSLRGAERRSNPVKDSRLDCHGTKVPRNDGLMKLFVKSILGGAFIALGALAAGIGSGGDSLLYALIFPVGLIMLVLFGASLFTGAVLEITDVLDKKSLASNYARHLTLIYLGNFIGAVLIGLVALLVARDSTIQLFQQLTAAKADTPLIELFVKGILCNILVCLAILLYRQYQQILLIYIPIFVFVLCGFEHSIADMFVFSFAPSAQLILPLIIISLGNLIGGILIALAHRYTSDIKRR